MKGQKRVDTFPKDISLKVNDIMQLELQLTTISQSSKISHNTTRTSLSETCLQIWLEITLNKTYTSSENLLINLF